MSTETLVTSELHLEQLRSFVESLEGALGEAGVGGARLGELLGRRILGECMQCGMRVTGGEIAEALARENVHEMPSPRQARLLQHYCARRGCPSYFYRFNFQPEEGLDWAGLLARAAELREARSTDAAIDRRRDRREQRLARHRRLGLYLGVLAGAAALWGIRHWWITGALPGFQPPNKYEVDPTSLRPQSDALGR